MDLNRLQGWLVVEAGRRQAWPFLALNDPDSGAETRLYLDTTFTVRPGWADLRQHDEAALVALDSLIGLTVTSSTYCPHGLLVVFGEHELQVRAEPNDLTSHDVWWTAP